MINLYSDTQTKPTPAMRQAMAAAEVGDEQMGEDPSVNLLCERVADLLGYEAALFTPSGTMCNQIAVLTHCVAGDEIICAANSHIINVEGAGAAALAGAAVRPVASVKGIFSGHDVEALLRPKVRSAPRSRMVSVEQTCNYGGGCVWPLDRLDDVVMTAHAHGLAAHMDGARLLNAVVASGVSARRQTSQAGFDSAWLDLSKGLGAPVGAVLCGSRDFIEAAWRWKYRLGGAMRQAGIIAAAGLYALDHHIERMADDHRRAKKLAKGLAALDSRLVDPAGVETNIVTIDTSGIGLEAAVLAGACAQRGLRITVIGPYMARAVTHLDISDADIRQALTIFAEALHATDNAPRAAHY